VDTKNLLRDDGSDRQTVEQLVALPPEFDGIATLTFVVEAIDSIDGRTFMVSPEHEELQREFDLET